MKVPLDWLREYVDADDAAATARVLTMAGVEAGETEEGVLDLEVTANRADLLSVIGVARELALLGKRPLRVPAVPDSAPVEEGVDVRVEDPRLCPRYVARVVRGVRVGPSPAWMQGRLEAAGLRPVNNIVDVTNYVLLECGQPLHAFDLRRLEGPAVLVRRARPGEKIVAIDGRDCELTGEMLVIADARRPVAIAGVMGGRDTEIGDGTTEILIESAQFDPRSVRRTSRKLGLASESSYRFERGVDWATVEWASRRAAALMAELGGGRAAPGAVEAAVPPQAPAPIRFRPDRVEKVLGLRIEESRVWEILEGLGCTRRVDGGVDPPPHRRDLCIEVDLIEEIARVEGYDRIPSDTNLTTRVVRDNREDLVREEVRSTLTGTGCLEVLTWSFAGEGGADDDFWGGSERVGLLDPRGGVDRTLRKSLMPALEEVLSTNAGYKEPLAPIFEIAKVYFAAGERFGERMVLGIATPAGRDARTGRPDAERAHRDLKGRFQAVLDRLDVAWDQVRHRMRMGEGLPGIAVGEMDFEGLVEKAKLDRTFQGLSRTPPVHRDLAVVVDAGTPWSRIEACVRASSSGSLERVRYFDTYTGTQIPAGKKSVAFSMIFRSADRTLAGEEIDTLVRSVVDSLSRELGAALRS